MTLQTEHSGNSFKLILGIAAVVALVLVILYALGLIGGEDKIAPGNVPKQVNTLPAGAEVIQVGKFQSNHIQTWPGSVQSRTVTKIAPKLMARILTVKVHTGDRVKKGALIAQLDEREISASLNEANAALNAVKATAAQAQADAQRSQELYAKEATTRANHDAVVARAKTAQAGVAQAQSRIEQIRVGMGENTLTAPFDGIIVERLKEPGDMGMPGDPVVTLLKPDDLRIEASIPAECIKRIQLSETIPVKIDAVGTTLSARLDEIMPEVDRQTGMQIIKAALPQTQGLQPGQFAWIEQNCADQTNELMIPLQAVLHFGQLEAVKVVDGQEIYTRHIRTGKQQGDQVVVLSGLREGEKIVRNAMQAIPEAPKQ